MSSSMSRREFLKRSICGASALLLIPGESKALPMAHLQTVVLGRSLQAVLLLGLNGQSISSMHNDEQAAKLLQEALGLQAKQAPLFRQVKIVLDLVWEKSPAVMERVAKAIKGRNRSKALLMTGTSKHKMEDCLRDLDRDLRLLGIDSMDVWTIKEDIGQAGWDYAFDKYGPLAAAIHAKDKGKARYIGLAGRRNAQFMLDMMKGFADFDVAEFLFEDSGSIGYEEFHKLVPRLLERDLGIVVNNPLATVNNPDGAVKPSELLYLMWSQLVSTVTPDVDSPRTFKEFADVAALFQTMPDAKQSALLNRLSKKRSTPPSGGAR